MAICPQGHVPGYLAPALTNTKQLDVEDTMFTIHSMIRIPKFLLGIFSQEKV